MNPRPILAILAFLFLWALVSGCAGRLDQGIAAVEKGAKAIDIGLDLAGDAWKAGVADRIEQCRKEGHETPEARRECLGRFADGDKAIAALQQASDAYDALAEALEALRRAAKDLEPYVNGGKP